MKEVNIFLSYCWADQEIADRIYNYFKDYRNIELYRDIIEIKKWSSIREYMQSIVNMDYTILIISDSYLKSTNCMYEVLEVMRDRRYKNKIFTAIIETKIYDPLTRAKYVKFWENKFEELFAALNELKVQNLGQLNMDLKKCQDIASNIAEFLGEVSDMNNPDIEEVEERIEDRLKAMGFIGEHICATNDTSSSEYDELKKQFRAARKIDGTSISAQTEALAHKLWEKYRDESGGIYLLDVARIRGQQEIIENIYYMLCMSKNQKIRNSVKQWNMKWRCVNE